MKFKPNLKDRVLIWLWLAKVLTRSVITKVLTYFQPSAEDPQPEPEKPDRLIPGPCVGPRPSRKIPEEAASVQVWGFLCRKLILPTKMILGEYSCFDRLTADTCFSEIVFATSLACEDSPEGETSYSLGHGAVLFV